MAMPIAPTPVLEGKEAIVFQRRLERDLKKPAKLIETPKLEKACELIKNHASKRKKCY